MLKAALFLSVALCVVSFGAEKMDAEKTFKNICSKCHGEQGEKFAGGKSAQISMLPKEELVKALKDYRSGKRNTHGMGGVMKSEMLKNTDEEIEALAKYISTLKK